MVLYSQSWRVGGVWLLTLFAAAACLPGLHSLYCTLRKSLKRDGESEINPHFLFLTSNSKREERREGIVDSGSEGNVSHFMLVVENQGALFLSLSLSVFFFFFTHTLLQWRQQQFSSGFTFSSDQLRESERERERQKERERERGSSHKSRRTPLSPLSCRQPSLRGERHRKQPRRQEETRGANITAPPGSFFIYFIFFIPLLLLLLLLFFLPFLCMFCRIWAATHTELDRERQRGREKQQQQQEAQKRWTSSRGWCTLTRGWAWQGTPACRSTCRKAPEERTATGENRTLETFYSKLWPSRIRVWTKPKPGKSSSLPPLLSGGGGGGQSGQIAHVDNKEGNTCWIIRFYSRVQVQIYGSVREIITMACLQITVCFTLEWVDSRAPSGGNKSVCLLLRAANVSVWGQQTHLRFMSIYLFKIWNIINELCCFFKCLTADFIHNVQFTLNSMQLEVTEKSYTFHIFSFLYM